ncbi:MAG TPA: hypothetical protein VJV78_10295 [Polyangiales bacterium]|nr:hypothetical protein [Polyangiales bacterium]
MAALIALNGPSISVEATFGKLPPPIVGSGILSIGVAGVPAMGIGMLGGIVGIAAAAPALGIGSFVCGCADRPATLVTGAIAIIPLAPATGAAVEPALAGTPVWVEGGAVDVIPPSPLQATTRTTPKWRIAVSLLEHDMRAASRSCCTGYTKIGRMPLRKLSITIGRIPLTVPPMAAMLVGDG